MSALNMFCATAGFIVAMIGVMFLIVRTAELASKEKGK
jgi:hypothetical protein